MLTCEKHAGSHRISSWQDDPNDPTGCRQIPILAYECIDKQGATDRAAVQTVQQFDDTPVSEDGFDEPGDEVTRVCYRMRYCLLAAKITGQTGGSVPNRFKMINGQPCASGDAGTTPYFVSYCEPGNGTVQSEETDTYTPPYGQCEYEEEYDPGYGSGY